MIALILLSALCGAVLAFRFPVMILIPVIMVAAALVIIVGSAQGADGSSIVFNAVGVAIAAQSGYLSGLYARGMMAASRAARRRAMQPDRQQTA